MKKKTIFLFVVVAIILSFLVINNKALFKHSTSIYTDAVCNISLLGHIKLIPKIFSNEISLYTKGNYEPLSFCILSLIKCVLKDRFNYESLHVFFVLVHLINTLIIFLIIKEFIDNFPSLLISFMFLIHPLFIISINDPNQFSLIVGLFFSLLSFLFYVFYLKKGGKICFLYSILFFIFAILTSIIAIFIPVFIGIFHQLKFKYKKLLIGISIYLSLLITILAAFGINIFFLFVASLLFVFIFIISSGIGSKNDIFAIFLHLLPFLILIGGWYGLSQYIGVKPIFQYPLYQIKSSHILKPFSIFYVWRYLFSKQSLFIFLIVPVFLIPFLLGNDRWQYILLAVLTIFYMIFSVDVTFAYKNDVSYWKEIAKNDKPIAMLNLAQAYINNKKFNYAKDILYTLKYEDTNLPNLVKDTINLLLGKLYYKTGNMKVAAYYFLQRPVAALPGASKIAKGRLIPIADFFFDLGYLSYAENYYASALVLDPYDAKIFKNLGIILTYKNFFRAALRYLNKALELEPRDYEALYYALFDSKILKDKSKYLLYKSRWDNMHLHMNIDFKEIYAKFASFNKRKTRNILSGDPVVLFYFGHTNKKFVYSLNNKRYIFWEVPFEIGKFFYRKHKYTKSVGWLYYAYKLSNGADEVSKYLKMAQEMSAIPTKEELMRAIKEQEMIENRGRRF